MPTHFFSDPAYDQVWEMAAEGEVSLKRDASVLDESESADDGTGLCSEPAPDDSLSDSLVEDEEDEDCRTGREEGAPARPWPRFSEAVLERAPVRLLERFPVARARRLLATHGARLNDRSRLVLGRMIEAAVDTGLVPATYAQKDYGDLLPAGVEYKGARRFGRVYCEDSTQSLCGSARDSLYGPSMVDVDMRNAHFELGSQMFAHLRLPTYHAYARDRDAFLPAFAEATGLGMAQMKRVASSVMDGARNFGVDTEAWEKLWADPALQEAMRARGISSIKTLNEKLATVEFLAGLRGCRRAIARDIRQRFAVFYAICEAKAERDGKNAEGVAYSLFMQDVENECLAVMVQHAVQRKLAGAEFLPVLVLMFDGKLLPGAIPKAALREMEAAVHKALGLRIRLVTKPMRKALPGFEGPDEAPPTDDVADDAVVDTTKDAGARPVFGRCIRRLSMESWVMKQRAELIARQIRELREQVKYTEDKTEKIELCRQIKALCTTGLYPLLDQLVYIVGDSYYWPVTNRRCVVTRYERVALNGASWAMLEREIKNWNVGGHARTRYTRATISFRDGALGRDVFNLWCGFHVEQQQSIPDPWGIVPYCDPWVKDRAPGLPLAPIQPMLDHVWLMAGEDRDIYALLLNDLADLVQNPHAKPTHCFVIVGPQGSGKSSGTRLMLEPILGRDDPSANQGRGVIGMYKALSNSTRLLQNFNGHLENAKAVVLDDETEGGDLVKKRGVTKSLITDEFMMIERKYEDARLAPFLPLIFILANEDHVVDIENKRQRRFVVVRMSDARKFDEGYFERLNALAADAGFRREWFKFLMQRDIHGFNRKSPALPQTDAMKDEYVTQRPPLASFLYERFLQNYMQEPLYTCGNQNCKAHATHGPGVVCENGRECVGVRLSWEKERRVPKDALRAAYNHWKQGLDASLRGAEYSFDRQVRLLASQGVLHNKLASGGPIQQRMRFDRYAKQEVTRADKEGGKAVKIRRTENVLVDTESVVVYCYDFPPLNEVWDCMAALGYINEEKTPRPQPPRINDAGDAVYDEPEELDTEA